MMRRNHLHQWKLSFALKVSFLEKQTTRLLAKFLELIVSRAKNDERGSLAIERESAREESDEFDDELRWNQLQTQTTTTAS